jgi:uncharacterized membrane protein YphA (DoxX/SURF4 family)
MKHASTIARILLGLIFFVFGLNGFLQFIPQPPLPDEAMKFMMGLMAAPYFFPLLKATEVIAGLLLLSNCFVPLALILLAPISLQIFLFHVALAPAGTAMAVVIIILGLYLAWTRKDSYKSVLSK